MEENTVNTAETTEKRPRLTRTDKKKSQEGTKAKLFQRAEKRVQENRLC